MLHVCRRWRKPRFWIRVAATSSNLQLFCTPKTPVKGTDWMDVWPGTLPSDHRSARAVWKIWIYHQARKTSLGQRNRVCSTHGLGRDWLSTRDETPRVIPDSSAHESLSGISCPGFPNLLWSTTCLVSLHSSLKPEVGQVVSACYCRSWLWKTFHTNKEGFRRVPDQSQPLNSHQVGACIQIL